jgi:quercetin dioxygenase-like cupin family protein
MKFIAIALTAVALSTPSHSLPCQQSTDIDPVTVSPDKYKVLLENDRVRVVDYSIKPGERDQPHTHPPKVSYVVTGGSLRITLRDTSFIAADSTGEVAWKGIVPWHYATNVGNTDEHIILFEVKRVDGEKAPASLDPAFVVPTDVSVRFENDSVRVIEALIPPGFKEKLHTHPPYVTYVLDGGNVRLHATDGTSRDAVLTPGQAYFTDKITHWAENIGTTTLHLILVEMRHK